MSHTLSRWQAIVLGTVVLAALGVGVFGLVRIAAKQGLGSDSIELVAVFPEAHDVTTGTPVRIRGVEAGQVVGIDYPDVDVPDAKVILRLRLNAKFADRLFADASARIQPTGMLGAKVIALVPGTPAAGPLKDGTIKGAVPPDLADAAVKLRDTAAEAELLIRDIRIGNGTVAKLIQDDELYRDLKGLTKETRGFIKRADGTLTAVEAELPVVRGFVRDGQQTIQSVHANSEAIKRMPVIRTYVESATALLIRPAHNRERLTFQANDLFPPNSALLSDAGKAHLASAVEIIKNVRTNQSDLVVAAFQDPAAVDQTSESALQLTRTRSEVVADFLKSYGAHKTSFWNWNLKVTPLGMGINSSPVVETPTLAPSRVEVIVFTPH